MKKLEVNSIHSLHGGSKSYGAGAICGIAVGTTVGLVATGVGAPLAIAFGAVSGAMCGGSIQCRQFKDMGLIIVPFFY